ncbi:hypothetical protein DSUL_20347 [Desulfovibrionales bacterium]
MGEVITVIDSPAIRYEDWQWGSVGQSCNIVFFVGRQYPRDG